MLDALKKAGLLGIGLAVLTEEKLREKLKELEEKGEITREEGKTIAKEAIEEREKQKKDLEKRIDKEVNRTIRAMGFATKKDMDDLGKKIDRLEKAIEKMTG